MEKIIRSHLEPEHERSMRDRFDLVEKVAGRLGAVHQDCDDALVAAGLLHHADDLERMVASCMSIAKKTLNALRPHHAKLANTTFCTGQKMAYGNWRWLREVLEAELGIAVLREYLHWQDGGDRLQYIVFGDWLDAEIKRRVIASAQAQVLDARERAAKAELEAIERARAEMTESSCSTGPTTLQEGKRSKSTKPCSHCRKTGHTVVECEAYMRDNEAGYNK